jgi:hypothetical protein
MKAQPGEHRFGTGGLHSVQAMKCRQSVFMAVASRWQIEKNVVSAGF